MRRAFLLGATLLVMLGTARGQSPSTQVSTQQLNLLPQNPVPAPTNVTIYPLLAGNTTYNYWIVVHVGSETGAPQGPYQSAGTAPLGGAITGVYFVWQPVTGATSYDVLRNTSGSTPTGACGCAVATGIVNTVITDNLSATTAYTVSTSADQIPAVLTNTNTGSGGGANQTLSNLTPTAINQDLLPASNGSNSLGSAADNWLAVHAYALSLYNAGTLATDTLGTDANGLHFNFAANAGKTGYLPAMQMFGGGFPTCATGEFFLTNPVWSNPTGFLQYCGNDNAYHYAGVTAPNTVPFSYTAVSNAAISVGQFVVVSGFSATYVQPIYSPASTSTTSGVVGVALTATTGSLQGFLLAPVGQVQALIDNSCSGIMSVISSTTTAGEGHCTTTPGTNQILGIEAGTSSGGLTPIWATMGATASSLPVNPGATLQLLVSQNGSTALAPLGVPPVTKTATYPAVDADRGTEFDFQITGAATFTVPAPANNWYVPAVINDPTSTATLTIAITSGSLINFGGCTVSTNTIALTAGFRAALATDATNTYAICSGPSSGSTAFSSLTPSTANLILNQTGFTSEFDATSAVANFFKLADITPATSGTAQSSPLLSLCGQEWAGGTPGNAQGCFTLQFVAANGSNTSALLSAAYSGSSTATSQGFSAPFLYGVNFVNIGSPTTATTSLGATLGMGNSGAVRFSNGGNWSTSTPDSSLYRIGAGLLGVGAGGTSGTGLFSSGDNVAQTGSSYTNATTTPSTFQSWTLPAVAHNYSYRCDLVYQSSATTDSLALSVNSSVAPTSEMAHARIFSTLTGTSTDATVTSTSSGNVAVLTGAAPNAATTNYEATMYGTIEEPAAGGTFSIQAASSAAGTITILRGSTCYIHP